MSDYSVRYSINVVTNNSVEQLNAFARAVEQLRGSGKVLHRTMKSLAQFSRGTKNLSTAVDGFKSIAGLKDDLGSVAKSMGKITTSLGKLGGGKNGGVSLNIDESAAITKLTKVQTLLNEIQEQLGSLGTIKISAPGVGKGNGGKGNAGKGNGGKSPNTTPPPAQNQPPKPKPLTQAQINKMRKEEFAKRYPGLDKKEFKRYQAAQDRGLIYTPLSPAARAASEESKAYVRSLGKRTGENVRWNNGSYNSAFRSAGNQFYKMFGPTPLPSNGGMAIGMLKGMGIAYGIAGIGQMISEINSQAVDYQSTMATVKNILQAHDTKGNFEGRFATMAETIRNVGKQTKFTVTEVADAGKYLAMAGLALDDINAAIHPVANLALIGDTNLGQTADLLTNIMTGYEIDSKQMNRAADIMANTFTRSNVTLPEIAETFKFFAPLAASERLPFAEATAAIGVLGDAGLKGSMAGTSLRRIMQNVMNPRGKKAKAWDAIGVKRLDSFGYMRPLEDIFSDLAAKNLKSSQIMQLFDVTTAQAATTLMRHVDKLKWLSQENKASGGASQRMADVKKNTMSGLWAQVKSTFIDAGVMGYAGIEERLRALMRKAMNYMTGEGTKGKFLSQMRTAGREIVEFVKLIVDATERFIGFFKFFAPVLKAYMRFQIMIWPITKAIAAFASLFRMVRNVQMFGVALTGLTQSLRGFSSAMASTSVAAGSRLYTAAPWAAPLFNAFGFNNKQIGATRRVGWAQRPEVFKEKWHAQTRIMWDPLKNNGQGGYVAKEFIPAGPGVWTADTSRYDNPNSLSRRKRLKMSNKAKKWVNQKAERDYYYERYMRRRRFVPGVPLPKFNDFESKMQQKHFDRYNNAAFQERYARYKNYLKYQGKNASVLGKAWHNTARFTSNITRAPIAGMGAGMYGGYKAMEQATSDEGSGLAAGLYGLGAMVAMAAPGWGTLIGGLMIGAGALIEHIKKVKVAKEKAQALLDAHKSWQVDADGRFVNTEGSKQMQYLVAITAKQRDYGAILKLNNERIREQYNLLEHEVPDSTTGTTEKANEIWGSLQEDAGNQISAKWTEKLNEAHPLGLKFNKKSNKGLVAAISEGVFGESTSSMVTGLMGSVSNAIIENHNVGEIIDEFIGSNKPKFSDAEIENSLKEASKYSDKKWDSLFADPNELWKLPFMQKVRYDMVMQTIGSVDKMRNASENWKALFNPESSTYNDRNVFTTALNAYQGIHAYLFGDKQGIPLGAVSDQNAFDDWLGWRDGGFYSKSGTLLGYENLMLRWNALNEEMSIAEKTGATKLPGMKKHWEKIGNVRKILESYILTNFAENLEGSTDVQMTKDASKLGKKYLKKNEGGVWGMFDAVTGKWEAIKNQKMAWQNEDAEWEEYQKKLAGNKTGTQGNSTAQAYQAIDPNLPNQMVSNAGIIPTDWADNIDWENVIENILEAIKGLIGAIFNPGNGILVSICRAIPKFLWNTAKEIFHGFWEKILPEWANNIVYEFIGWIQQLWSGFKRWMYNCVPDWVKEFLPENWFRSWLGDDVVDGTTPTPTQAPEVAATSESVQAATAKANSTAQTFGSTLKYDWNTPKYSWGESDTPTISEQVKKEGESAYASNFEEQPVINLNISGGLVQIADANFNGDGNMDINEQLKRAFDNLTIPGYDKPVGAYMS